MFSDSARGRARACRPAVIKLMASAAALLMVGCGSAVSVTGHPGPHVTIARENTNGKTVRVGVGDRLELILSSTYWNVHGSSTPAVLRQDGPVKLLSRPSTCPDLPGVGCTPMQIPFTALTRGTAVIIATRTTCGEALRCAPNQRRFRVTIVVG